MSGALQTTSLSSVTVDSCCSNEPRASATAGSQWGARGTTACAVALALVPKCPACWSVYAGLSSWLGLSIAMETHYLLPLTCATLGLTLGFLGWRARQGGGSGPLLLALIAAGLVIIGKFATASSAAVYVGIGALLTASLWSRSRPSSMRTAALAKAALRTAP